MVTGGRNSLGLLQGCSSLCNLITNIVELPVYISTHREFCHKNLLKFHGICTQEGPLLIVTELMPKGQSECLLN